MFFSYQRHGRYSGCVVNNNEQVLDLIHFLKSVCIEAEQRLGESETDRLSACCVICVISHRFCGLRSVYCMGFSIMVIIPFTCFQLSVISVWCCFYYTSTPGGKQVDGLQPE